MSEEQIFLNALDLPDAAARATYLDEVCQGDAQLRQQVETLLASHFKSGEFLDVPAGEQIASGDATAESHPGNAITIQSGTMNADKHGDDEDALEFLAPSTRPDSLGRIDHYEVLQVLGKGGFGIVLRAFDDVLQRVVAVKVMAPQMAATSPARKRFLREARNSAQVRHENVVQVYEVGEQPLPHLVMEFIPGETLQQRLDRMGPLDVNETLRIGRQIAEGLAAAHAMDLIHRDIKPGNVLLEGGQHKVKITDFGLARAADDASMTQSGQIAGTPMYMAPEQALGETLDQRADLFSLGSVLYQMVAGRAPFRANTAVAVLKRVAEDTPRNIREVIPETPQWLCDIITKLHAKKPDDRFQSAREVADVLADCEAQLKQSSRLRDFSRIPRTQSQPLGRRKTLVVATAVFLLSLIALAVTEYAGVTNLLERLATRDPVEPAIVSRPVVAALPTADSKETELQRNALRGNWLILSGEANGDPLHKDFLSAVSIAFDDALELKIGDFFESRNPIALDGGASPKTIMGSGGEFKATWSGNADQMQVTASSLVQRYYLHSEFRGIYELEGNQLKLCIAQGGYSLPKRFDSRTDDGAQFGALNLVLERAPDDQAGWVQLFNGKDLTGWKFHSDHPGHWEVKYGILRGSKRQSHLFSNRGDYRNFHLRAEVKINLGGDSGLLFRAPLELVRGRTPYEFGIPGCYEAELQHNRLHVRPTGTISEAIGDAPPTRLGQVLDTSLTQPDEWFTYEVIAVNNHFITKINGTEAANCTDPQGKHQVGHLALQVWHPNTLVQFRKIEIKELPANPPESDGFVALFNGKDLTGWKTHSLSGGDWRVVDGAIDGRGTTSYLFSNSGDYANFHLLVEAKINGNGDAGVYIRTPFDVQGLPNPGPAKYALLAGYEAAIALRANYPTHTGSLTAADGSTLHAGPLVPHQPDEWFVLEVIAEDNHIRTLVDGKPAAEYIDEKRRASRGHIALQTWGPNITSVQFRKVEIKELPANAPSSVPPSLQALRELVAAKESERDLAKQSARDGQLSKLDLIYAEIDALEARVQLTQAEGNAAANIAALRSLVAFREQERELIVQQVKAGQLKADDQERADSSLMDARGRLAKALAVAPADALAAQAAQQVEEVRKELMRLNSKFDGKLEHKVEGGVVTELSINSDELLDISPVRALAGLVYLDCRGTYPNKGKLSDLSPLKGMKLSRLDCSSTQIADLTPLTGVPLTWLHFNHNPVSDLTPLQGMPLEELGLAETKVADLSPLKGMKIKVLGAQLLLVTDLSPLAGMPLTGLDLYHTVGVTDLGPLAGLPLEGLNLQDVPVSDLSPIKGMTTLRNLLLQGNAVTDLSPLKGLKLTDLILRDKQISDLSPLEGMPLARLEIYGTGVSDLTPLKGMPLQEIRLTPQNITQGLDILRDIKSLKTIGIDGNQAWPAAEFWERSGKGEFGK